MAINFLDPESTTVLNGILRGSTSAASPVLNNIITSKDVSGIEVRMLPPFIKDNHTERIWPFPGLAQMYCLTIVVSDVTNQLAGAIDLKGFPRMGDNEFLPMNKTIFYWQSENDTDKGPSQIHVFCSIIKSKKSLRDVAKVLGEMKDDDGYKGLIGSLSSLTKTAAQFNVVTDIILELAGVVGKYLGNVEDKPIGTVINSYTTLHGDFDNAGISPLLYNTPDTDFKFEVVVRNKAILQALAKGQPAGAIAELRIDNNGDEVNVDMTPL
ncbi:MAG: hypothetical protein ABIN89_30140 [Chitinophagaceae bacterium]